ncbi:hypothetical protein B0H17DRAFT_599960 [Mycena rosella]|uniref:Uncharacterized protein n=1 Tax=Mycena rosella TaxID=1033263 RepID=A0AAD7DFJ8_MYCRO|nr:hypothetical protein B0H17DRAFT_599960 [Mycena rosella]
MQGASLPHPRTQSLPSSFLSLHKMPHLNGPWLSFFTVSIAVLLTLVAIVGYESFLEGVNSQDKAAGYGVNLTALNDPDATTFTNWTDGPALEVLFTVDTFDPSKGTTSIGIHLDYQPLNDLVDETQALIAPAVPVRLLLQSVTSNFAANTIMPSTTGTERTDGDVNRYPFDVFTVDYTIYAFTSPGNGSYGAPLPMTVISTGSIQGFKIDTTVTGQDPFDGSAVLVHVEIRRSPITQAFSIIVILGPVPTPFIPAGLPLTRTRSDVVPERAIFTAAMSVYFRERKAELPLIALSTALLFALPNVRNSQPGIPATAGTISDMVGFFWNLLLVATSAISLLANFVVKNGRGKEAAAKV